MGVSEGEAGGVSVGCGAVAVGGGRCVGGGRVGTATVGFAGFKKRAPPRKAIKTKTTQINNNTPVAMRGHGERFFPGTFWVATVFAGAASPLAGAALVPCWVSGFREVGRIVMAVPCIGMPACVHASLNACDNSLTVA